MRQSCEPFAQQRVDLVRPETVTDLLQAVGVIDRGEPVVEGVERDPGLGGLALGPMVAVEAQLGVEREVGAELHEERAEVVIDAIEVPLVDHAAGLDDPWVRGAVGVAAFLGAEHPGLLLRPADEQHPLATTRRGMRGEILVHHVVLALSLGEVHDRHPAAAGIPSHRGAESLGDRRQRRRRGDRTTQLVAQVADQTEFSLQLRHIHIEIHPVDALHLEHHMIGQHISSSAR